MSVTWVLTSGSYEVSSKNHLLQIMHEGSLLSNTGNVPSNFLTVSYIQTADIDMQQDTTNIIPIDDFSGVYDGQNHSISNWSCTNFTNSQGHGLFGRLAGNPTIQNMVLDGVWSLLNHNDGGFLVGTGTGNIFNIRTDFSTGTETISATGAMGVLIGNSGNSIIQNITLGGTISNAYGAIHVGGVVGYSTGGSISHVRNIATFTTGLRAGGIRYIGGIVSWASNTVLSNLLNAMRGNLQADTTAVPGVGGIVGYMSGGSMDMACNSMIGNITGKNASAIVSVASGTGTLNRCLSYITGNVESGLMGTLGSFTVSKSIVAMNGVTTYAARISTSSSIEVLMDDSYGLTYTSSIDTVTSMDTSSFLTSSLTTQPYFSFSLADGASNQINWPFIFGNVSGNTDFDWYMLVNEDTITPAHITFSSITPPALFKVDFSNETITVSGDNISLTTSSTTWTLLSTSTFKPWSTFVEVSSGSVVGAISYKVTYIPPGGTSETIAVRNTTEKEHIILNLEPETT